MRLHRLSLFAFSTLASVGLLLARPSHAAVSKITIDPTTSTVASGQTVSFTVKAVDGSTSTDVTNQTVFSTNDPKGSTSGATYTGGEAGTWEVQASYQSFLASATVTVTPGAVTEVEINPNSDPEVVFNGASRKFTARAYDAKNNLVSGQTFSWSVIGPVGEITSNGIFSAQALGTGKVQAVDGSITGQIAVEVRAAPVVNTNTAATVNANTSVTNQNKNTNAATTSNANANANITNTNSSTLPSGSTSSTCTTIKPWLWTLILIIFLVAVAVLYGLVPVTKIWPVLLALVGAGILAYVQRTYDCSLQTWWAWVITLGTIVLTVLAIRSKPMPVAKQ